MRPETATLKQLWSVVRWPLSSPHLLSDIISGTSLVKCDVNAKKLSNSTHFSTVRQYTITNSELLMWCLISHILLLYSSKVSFNSDLN